MGEGDAIMNNATNEKSITVIGENAATLDVLNRMQTGISQTAMMMQAMADTIRANQAIMAELAREVHNLTKVTPAQVKALNAAIKERAEEVCQASRAAGGEKACAAAIRKHVKLTMGITGMRELPRADWAMAMDAIKGWNDFRTMKKIREGLRG